MCGPPRLPERSKTAILSCFFSIYQLLASKKYTLFHFYIINV